MKKLLLILALFPFVLTAQEPDEKIYDFVDYEPEFPGGAAAMSRWIQENVTYPTYALEHNEQGIVYVKFVVGKTGEIGAVKVVKGVSESLNAEALRVVSLMPRWKPGMIQGEPVPVNFTLPINFVLEGRKHKKKKNRRR
jgi:periplasmic protein TonB